MPRLFIGVPAPEGLELSGVRNALKQRGGNVKLVDPDLYHVTLAFLGDTPASETDTIIEAIEEGTAGIEPHSGQAQGLGAFPSPKRASVVWTGIAGTRLDPLANRIRQALTERGIGFDDRHDFHAHLTLARLRDKRNLSQLIDPHEATSFGSFPVESVTLFESTLTPEGPIYEPRGTIALEA